VLLSVCIPLAIFLVFISVQFWRKGSVFSLLFTVILIPLLLSFQFLFAMFFNQIHLYFTHCHIIGMLVFVSNCKCKLHVSVHHHSGDSDSDMDRAAQQKTTVHEFRGYVFLLLHLTYCAASGQKVYSHTFVVYVSQISQ